jgi:hypothetical protein
MGKISGVDYEKTKAAIAAVVGFNDAHDVKYSRVQLANYFGITTRSLSNWFPVGSSRKSQAVQGKSTQKEAKSPGQKRPRSEDPTEGIPSASSSQQPVTPPRQNPIRNGGRGRKKLKMMLEDEISTASSTPPLSCPSGSSSFPPHEELVTPPNRKNAQPGKRAGSKRSHQAEDEEEAVKREGEGWDDGTEA